MTITLPSELDRFLQGEVAAGRYASVSEAVCEAVKHLRRKRAIAQLREKLDVGLAEIERGEGIEIDTDEDEDRVFSEFLSAVSETPGEA